jgi:hypothetical protein
MPRSKEKLLQRATQKFRKEDPTRYERTVKAIIRLIAKQYK